MVQDDSPLMVDPIESCDETRHRTWITLFKRIEFEFKKTYLNHLSLWIQMHPFLYLFVHLQFMRGIRFAVDIICCHSKPFPIKFYLPKYSCTHSPLAHLPCFDYARCADGFLAESITTGCLKCRKTNWKSLELYASWLRVGRYMYRWQIICNSFETMKSEMRVRGRMQRYGITFWAR